MTIQAVADSTPTWANWLIIGGSALVSWITPVAGVVAIVWGGMQIYSWIVNKDWKKKRRR